ncbi:GNAT family N-acetyltransferase [Kribbella koreensis]|uniref:GNAT family N-acetyltransferase n=1 Tax=Kribbella koreensis TaxID=57909 RepID=A0ABP4BL60_9ACTN
MQDLVQRIYGAGSRFHIGDIGWELASVPPERQAGWRIALWSDGDQDVAWGWIEGNGLLLVVDPARPEVAGDVLDWFREETGPAVQRLTSVLESETHLIDAIEKAGFVLEHGRPYYTHHNITLDDLGTPVVPDGFTLRHVRADEIEKRAAVHRAAWSDVAPSKMTAEAMAAVMSTWPYRPELDWVVENSDGVFVASALIWLDEQHRAGLVEPVGCAPQYRRLGLGQAVNLGALHALKELGGVEARVCPRGDDGYPIPAKLYQSIGFRPGLRTVDYVGQKLDL